MCPKANGKSNYWIMYTPRCSRYWKVRRFQHTFVACSLTSRLERERVFMCMCVCQLCEVLVRSKCLHNIFSGYFRVCYPFNLKGICENVWHRVVHQEVAPHRSSDPFFTSSNFFYSFCYVYGVNILEFSVYIFKCMVDVLWAAQNTLSFAQYGKKNESKFSH